MRFKRCEIRLFRSQTRQAVEKQRIFAFGMRPEQKEAVTKTAQYFRSFHNDENNKEKTPHFCGMPKCALVKPLPLISLPKKWVGKRFWC